MSEPSITITRARDLDADPSQLSAAERGVLALPPGARRDEWIRGRIALRRALVALLGPAGAGVDILVAPDGGPAPTGGPSCAVSLSHDGDWIAVAAAAGPAIRLGIDLCARDHAARIAAVLARLRLHFELDPCLQWAALEATLKLRRLSIFALREHPISLRERDRERDRDRDRDRGATLEVLGLGAPALVRWRGEPGYVVAWTAEPA